MVRDDETVTELSPDEDRRARCSIRGNAAGGGKVGHGPEIGIALVLDVSAPEIGTVILRVGIDPGCDLEQILPGQRVVAAPFAGPRDQFARRGAERARRHRRDVARLGVVLADDLHLPVLQQRLVGLAEERRRRPRKVQRPLGAFLAVAPDAMLVQDGLHVGRIV